MTEDDEKMGEDKKETDNQGIGEEEHQKARCVQVQALTFRADVRWKTAT